MCLIPLINPCSVSHHSFQPTARSSICWSIAVTEVSFTSAPLWLPYCLRSSTHINARKFTVNTTAAPEHLKCHHFKSICQGCFLVKISYFLLDASLPSSLSGTRSGLNIESQLDAGGSVAVSLVPRLSGT